MKARIGAALLHFHTLPLPTKKSSPDQLSTLPHGSRAVQMAYSHITLLHLTDSDAACSPNCTTGCVSQNWCRPLAPSLLRGTFSSVVSVVAAPAAWPRLEVVAEAEAASDCELGCCSGGAGPLSTPLGVLEDADSFCSAGGSSDPDAIPRGLPAALPQRQGGTNGVLHADSRRTRSKRHEEYM